jgi:hemerythrin
MAYAKTHFETEEAMLKKCGYVHLDAHIAEHEAYLKSLTYLLLSTAHKNEDRAELYQYLMFWWTGHILSSDMKYKECVENMFVEGVRNFV